MNKKIFAFKVAAQKAAKQNTTNKRWQARADIATAGCTDPHGLGCYQYRHEFFGADAGIYC